VSWWLQPTVDATAAALALMVVGAFFDVRIVPAFPLAPLMLALAYTGLGVYGAAPGRGLFDSEGGLAWPVIRLLVAALFAWVSSLLVPLGGGEQLALWAVFLVFDVLTQRLVAPLFGHFERPERWVVVGNDSILQRLDAYGSLPGMATIVGVIPVGRSGKHYAERSSALEAIDRLSPDRVVISSQDADEKYLLELVYVFKSLGVEVSLLPRPLDLLDLPATARASRVGGLPLVEVQELVPKRTKWSGADRRRDRSTKVSVVVPAMNEEKNIGHVLRSLPDDLHEVILVDGNSRDHTIAVAEEAYPGIRVERQRGRGKGDALRVGFAAVSGNLVVMLDADGSADPAEIPRFVEALEAGADFAKGSRFLEGGGSVDITPVRQLGNAFLNGTANLMHGTRFTDLCYGYNAFWTRCLPFISLDVPGFEVETLINLRVAAAGMKITEVPSREEMRISGQSNLKTFRDGFRVMGTILSESRRRRSIRRRHRIGAVDLAARSDREDIGDGIAAAP
jgi:hypothetical protein